MTSLASCNVARRSEPDAATKFASRFLHRQTAAHICDRHRTANGRKSSTALNAAVGFMEDFRTWRNVGSNFRVPTHVENFNDSLRGKLLRGNTSDGERGTRRPRLKGNAKNGARWTRTLRVSSSIRSSYDQAGGVF
jgi:hypothetical protein